MPGHGARRAAQQEPATSVRAVRVVREGVQPWIYGQGTARAVRREFLTFPSAGRIAYVDPTLKVGDTVTKGPGDRLPAARSSAGRAGQCARRCLASRNGPGRGAGIAARGGRQSRAGARDLRALQDPARQAIRHRSRSTTKPKRSWPARRQPRPRPTRRSRRSRPDGRASAAQLDQAQVTVSESRIVSPIDGVLATAQHRAGLLLLAADRCSRPASRVRSARFRSSSSTRRRSRSRVDLPAYAIGTLTVGADRPHESGEATPTRTTRAMRAGGTRRRQPRPASKDASIRSRHRSIRRSARFR